MSLKFQIDRLEDVAAPLREHYAKGEDGKFYLSTSGEHPKISEMRNSNIETLKERDALKTKLTALEAMKPEERITALETALAAEKTIRVDAQQKADRSRVRDVLRVKAVAAGVLPAALDIFLDKAEPVFTMNGDQVQARPDTFSPTKPGELLTVDEWIASSTKDLAFLFGRSNGGGALPSTGAGFSDGNVVVLRDPTPQQLGEHAAAITKGKVRVEYS